MEIQFQASKDIDFRPLFFFPNLNSLYRGKTANSHVLEKPPIRINVVTHGPKVPYSKCPIRGHCFDADGKTVIADIWQKKFKEMITFKLPDSTFIKKEFIHWQQKKIIKNGRYFFFRFK